MRVIVYCCGSEALAMDERRRQRLDEVSQIIIGCAHRVSNTLGTGFLEKVYENALALELRCAGLEVEQQHGVEVLYRRVPVGLFHADLLVQQCVIVELKAVTALNDVHRAQCLNYLRASGLAVCLLMNFHTSRLTVKRIVFEY